MSLHKTPHLPIIGIVEGVARPGKELLIPNQTSVKHWIPRIIGTRMNELIELNLEVIIIASSQLKSAKQSGKGFN